MTQTQFVSKLADACEVNKKVSKQFLDSLATIAVKEVKANGVFVVPGLGRLVRVDRKARIGRNPATGETINIPAKKVTYDDHVLPILREACFACHNQDKKRGGLRVDNYTAMLRGGSSGEVVKPGMVRHWDAGRLELIEIAPGIDLERDIFRRMDFRPDVAPGFRPMDARLFKPEPMGLADDLARRGPRVRSGRLAALG